MRTRTRRRYAIAGVALSCVSVVAACSPDREQQAVPTAPPVTAPSPTQAAAAPGTTTAGRDPSATENAGTAPATSSDGTAVATTEAAVTTAAAAAGPMFGDLPWPCGPAETPNTDDGSEPGVSAEEILIGYGDDAGFAVVPGLNHEASDAIKAMIAACNELGGINGRIITGNYYDAKLTEPNAATLRACSDEVFFLVGTAWAFDEQQEEIRQGCGLPAVPTYSVSGAFSHAPLMYQGLPNPADEYSVTALELMAQQFPEEVQSASVLAINIGATIITRDKVLAVADAAGWNFLSTDIMTNPMGESDYTPFSNQLQQGGAELVYFFGQCEPMLRLFMQTASVNGYEPIVFSAPNMYEPRCAEQNTDGTMDNLYFNLDIVPMFEAEHNPATQAYLDVMETHGGDQAALGIQATSTFLLWATAADVCGAALTRQCVLDNMAEVHEWTAGGLHSPSDPGGNHGSTCTALFKVSGTGYERVFPLEPATYDCGEDGDAQREPVDLPAVDALLLDENRVSHLYSDE